MEQFRLSKESRVLIIGAGHGIGFSLAQALSVDYKVGTVVATYRDIQKAGELLTLEGVEAKSLNPCIEEEVEHFFAAYPSDYFDAIFISVGALGFQGRGPEKGMRDFNLSFALDNFLVNALVTPLILKYAQSKLARQRLSVVATLSAKVGSIEDNQFGGWYSYRASKCALNMYLKSISIELLRSRFRCQIFALHPGTVSTDLSREYLKNVQHEIFTPTQAAINLLHQVQGWEQPSAAKFINYKGETIPW